MSDETKVQLIPAGFNNYEWLCNEVLFLGESVNIDSLIAYLKLKISFTKEDFATQSELHQSYIKLIGQQGWCIKGSYHMPLCIALPWLKEKTQKNLSKAESLEKKYREELPVTIQKFISDNVTTTWYKFCRAVREAKKEKVEPKLDVEDLPEETKALILNWALKICKY